MNILWNVIRGGQTRLHNIRMILQIIKRIGILCLIFYAFFIVIFFFAKTNATQRDLASRWLFSNLLISLKFDPNSITTFTDKVNCRTVKVSTTHRHIVQYIPLIKNFQKVKKTFIDGLYWGVICMSLFIILVCWYLYRTGFNVSKEKIISGETIIDTKKLQKLLKVISYKDGLGIQLAGIKISKGMEVTHTFIIGASGSGKSVLCKEILSSVRAQRNRAIVYDVSGEFVKIFFDSDRDIILNPLDDRAACWDLWRDCHRPEHFHSFAEAVIPSTANNIDDFFIKAARTVLANIAERVSYSEKSKLEHLLKLLLSADFHTLTQYVKGTEAAAILNEEGGRTAASVRAVIAANIKSLTYLCTDGPSFSLRDWVKKITHPSGFIFITSNDEQLPLLRSLITLWVNIVTTAILSLEPDIDRRIFLVLDELSSLNRIPSLNSFLSQGRKYGGSAILCTQGCSQMIRSLGEKEMRAVAGGCSNWAVLRCNDIEGAEWLSKSLSWQETIEKSEGVSYGAHEMRDSVSLHEHRRERAIVSPSELLNLPNLTGYLRLGRGMPLVKFNTKHVPYTTVAKSFVERPVVNAQEEVIKSDENELEVNQTTMSPFL